MAAIPQRADQGDAARRRGRPSRQAAKRREGRKRRQLALEPYARKTTAEKAGTEDAECHPLFMQSLPREGVAGSKGLGELAALVKSVGKDEEAKVTVEGEAVVTMSFLGL